MGGFACNPFSLLRLGCGQPQGPFSDSFPLFPVAREIVFGCGVGVNPSREFHPSLNSNRACYPHSKCDAMDRTFHGSRE